MEGELAPDAEARFEKGQTLKDGTVCLPARLERLAGDDAQRVRVTLREGKYHQVKRMIAAVGGVVVQLRRVQLGSLPLDSALKEGEFRALTDQELALLQQPSQESI